ncbi:unnamed protein product [Polarella glacialis]|uniref:Uncharacterized protein n=1 Tax=Polarella glacialis TaxID=89957 RepID=A0A813IJA5_POLGL|nr:unnamed protein product [Polarella glacialis]
MAKRAVATAGRSGGLAQRKKRAAPGARKVAKPKPSLLKNAMKVVKPKPSLLKKASRRKPPTAAGSHTKKSLKQGDKHATIWTRGEEAILRKLSTPAKIQGFLDLLHYDGSDHYWSVRATLRSGSAHCMGGAILASYCLQRNGYGPPRVVGFDSKNDDTHAVAVYQVNGYWGAIGKSNFTLIPRDPVYRSLRELMMSYFDFYFNTKREKSMMGYTRPFNLERTGQDWKFAEGPIEDVLKDFDDVKKTPWIPVRPPGMRESSLLPASQAILQAGLLGSNPKGLFKPR